MHCKNETYKGDYGFTATGTITGLGAFAVVGRFTADGQGNITGSQTRNFDGAITLETYTETYTVTPDCTGSSHKQTSTGVQTNWAFVILNQGRTVEAIEIDPGAVLSWRAERMD